MTAQQKKVATAVTLLIVSGAAIFLFWLTVDVLRGHVRGDYTSARMFMLTIANWNGLAIILKGLATLTSVGLALLGAYRLKDWLFYSIVAITVLGTACAIYLYLEVSSVSTAKNFWAYSPSEDLQEYKTFVTAAQRGLSWAVIWFVAVLLSELGIKKMAAP